MNAWRRVLVCKRTYTERKEEVTHYGEAVAGVEEPGELGTGITRAARAAQSETEHRELGCLHAQGTQRVFEEA